MPSYDKLLFGPAGGFPVFLFFAALVWTVFWQGLSLWRSARNNQKYWFVALLLINPLGVLQIIYLAFFQQKRK